MLERLLTSLKDGYQGADRRNAVRLVVALWLLTGILIACFMPLEPPTEELGAAGWFIAGALAVTNVAGAMTVRRRRERVSFDALLGICYLGLVEVAALQWLGGGLGSAYQNLYLLWLGAAMGVHPPLRALTFLGATALAAFSPLLYYSSSWGQIADTLAGFLLWATLGLLMLALMSYVRSQRVTLRSQEQSALRLARIDALTGLGNRRAFEESLETEMARTQRSGASLSVVLMDVDRLKEINDHFGHLEGDRCLKSVAGAMRMTLRGADRVFRWGGDEFVLLLPDTDHEGAEGAAARAASHVADHCASADGRPLAICWGVAELASGLSPDELLPRADLALLAQKRVRLGAEESEAAGRSASSGKAAD